ncbi:class V lanthionine synthetase subunit LxmK [Streptomyces olivaceoviridis]|uniref:class V lanthionine synthetase subunit LxmK n=1 Tax=Streptomyces olivaceoviridis TaxID=1921 RepID=UPI0033AD7569
MPNTLSTPHARSARRHVRALELSRVPQVNELLDTLGLGRLREADVTSYPGRNANWAGTTTRGVKLFVKRLDGAGRAPGRRLERAIAFEQARRAGDRSRHLGPTCLGWDSAACLMAFELLEDARSGSDVAETDDGFSTAWCERAGELVADVHGLAPDPSLPAAPASFFPRESLRALTAETYLDSTRAELDAWALLQRDTPLHEALDRLRDASATAVARPLHADLRLDQFLISAGEMYLSDWEEFCLGDPARDLGSLAGEWLFRSLTRVIRGESAPAPTHEEMTARLTEAIAAARVQIAAFWQSYLTARHRAADAGRAGSHGAPDRDLAVRAAAYAGWHMYDRLLAGATQSARLGAVDRAAAGIGRRILLTPERFTTTLGLEVAA